MAPIGFGREHENFEAEALPPHAKLEETPPIGFLEESAGVRSSSRLVAVLMTVAALGLVITMIYVAVRGGEFAAGIIAGLAGALTGTAGGVWGVIRSRTVPPEDV